MKYVDYVKENADYYGENAADFEQTYTRETIVNALYESKVSAVLLDKASVTETPYTGEDDMEYEDGEELDDLEVIGEVAEDGAEKAEAADTEE